MMGEKRKLLITWPSRTFFEVIYGLVEKLSEHHEIFVLLQGCSTPKGIQSHLFDLKGKGLITGFKITPNIEHITRNHIFIWQCIDTLSKFEFDVWLSPSVQNSFERYIEKFIVPEYCIKVCMWHNITFLFMYHEGIVARLVEGKSQDIIDIREYAENKTNNLFDYYLRKTRKALKQNGMFTVIRKVFISFHKVLFVYIKKNILTFYDRVLLPLLLVQTTFLRRKYDSITQIGTDNISKLILFDPLEVQAHRKLLTEVDVIQAEYPTSGCCKCGSGIKKYGDTVLSPLSNFVNSDYLKLSVLEEYYREFNTVLNNTGASDIHLRLHPDDTGQWPKQLRDYLVAKGLNVTIVEAESPLREVVCDYKIVCGSASASLRDCRNICKFIAVVGFESVSSWQFENARFVFGQSEGISWIDRDGAFYPDTFTCQVEKQAALPKVTDVISQLGV